MADLKFFKVDCPIGSDLEKILRCMHTPQFKHLDTVHLSLCFSSIQSVATNGSGLTFEFSRFIKGTLSLHPLRYFGADIITLRLDRGITLDRLDDELALYEFLRSLDTVQVLEFDALITDCVKNVLSVVGIFPRLKVIRVAASLVNCKGTLRLLAAVSKLRMEEGNPLTTVERLVAEGEDGLDQRLHAKWKKRYRAEGMQDFLSK